MMASPQRDSRFPATSIGRTQGATMQRDASQDTLSAHPLLTSALSPSSAPSDHSSGKGGHSPRSYVPYTPRQRVSPTAVTTGTIVRPSTPQHLQGDATSRLQLVNLKAAAQSVDLDAGSVGWAMLEKLVAESDYHDPEWTAIWNILTSGKATLLLPLEQASSHESLTPDFFRDHVILHDGPPWSNSQLVTLSGLRGILEDKTLTIRSTINASSKDFQDLLSPSTRSSSLSLLPNLPVPSSSSYPTFKFFSHTPTLPLPPHALNPHKPPLPPRPGTRPPSTTGPNAPTSRLSNPFASLFGHGPSPHQPKQSPAPASQPAPTSSSPTSSVRSTDSQASSSPTAAAAAEHTIDVSAFTIDRKIVRKDVGKDLNKALRREVKDTLKEALLPSWVIDRVHDFTADWYPFVRNETTRTKRLGKAFGDRIAKENGAPPAYVVNPLADKPENASQRLQDFYLGLEHDMRLTGTSPWGRTNSNSSSHNDYENTESGKPAAAEDAESKRVQDKIDSESRLKESIDAVERTICTLFYDRLYMQPTSDDSLHDEALSGRVAALNMLDLGLEHLDVYVGDAGSDLDLVVKACGEMLTQLNTCRSPADKAAVLVAAHKIIVDGLARLPPIRLMSEEESKAQKTKASNIAKPSAPPRDIDGKLRILAPIVHSDRQLSVSPPEQSVAPNAENTKATETQPSPVPTIVEPEATREAEKAGSDQQGVEDIVPSSPTSPTTPTSIARSASPILKLTPAPPEATPISGDVLLPMIIFSVVKSNPLHLVSNLLYTQRFRNQSVGGEESYCLINLMAVAEFLENVDLAALGLSDTDKVLSAADLTPIPLNRTPISPERPLTVGDGISGSFRGRVEQANRVITDVVDSSFGILRSLLPGTAPQVAPVTPHADGVQNAAPWNAAKPGFGLLRRESGFSIKSLTAALPINRAARSGGDEESGQQLVAVSRPGSLKEKVVDDEGTEDEDGNIGVSGHEDNESDEDDEGDDDSVRYAGDSKSIRSFESMMSGKRRGQIKPRKSLSDRLASMSSLAGLKGSPPASRRSSLLPFQAAARNADTHGSSRPTSPTPLRLAPPIRRFVECTPDDLRLSEVGELLRDYRRLVEGIRAVGGFDE